MRDLIESAMADGSYESIPDFLIGGTNQPASGLGISTLSHRSHVAQHSGGQSHLFHVWAGLPMFGQLGRAFAPISTVQGIIKEAGQKAILAKEDGLVLLDSLIPRSTVQLLDVEDMYNLSTRLFERGVRGVRNGARGPVVGVRN